MMYFVYSIGDMVEPDKSITQEKEDNLNKIIINVLGSQEMGFLGTRRRYKIAEQNIETHKITYYRREFFCSNRDEEKQREFITGLANDLLNSELVTEKNGTSRRHKRITPGILIVKHTNQQLSLLKLEETRSIDKKTYATLSTFATDKKYYKAAIITMDSINIIDNSRRVANYWSEGFLNLVPLRDDTINSKDLAKLLSDGKLLSNNIVDDGKKQTTKQLLRQLAFEQTHFDPEKWLDELNNELPEEMESFASIQDLFSMEALEQLDNQFRVDKKIIGKTLKTTLTVADDITIQAINIDTLIKRDVMSYNDGVIYITVPLENREAVERIFNR